MLKLKSITKYYDDQLILDSVDLTVNAKEFVSIMGKSGVGKSTLLSIIAGLIEPDQGEILFEDQKLNQLNEARWSQFRLKNIGFIFQDFKVINALSVFDNVFLPLHPRQDLTAKQKKQQVIATIKRVGLRSKLKQTVNKLSGGEKQRVAIARSLVHQPKLVLADEPTGNLDEITSKEILALFKKLHRELNTSFIIITHDKDIANQTQIIYQLKQKKLVRLKS